MQGAIQAGAAPTTCVRFRPSNASSVCRHALKRHNGPHGSGDAASRRFCEPADVDTATPAPCLGRALGGACAGATRRGLRGDLRSPSSGHPVVLPAHAGRCRRGRGRRSAHVHGRVQRPDRVGEANPPASLAVHDRAQPLLHDPAGPPRAALGGDRGGADRGTRVAGAAPRGPTRAGRRHAAAARRAARGARARRARFALALGHRRRARRPPREGQGPSLPGARVAAGESHGP